MGRKKCQSKISSRNQSNTEKDRERKRNKRAILRGEEVANQPILGELNSIFNNIGVIYF